MIQTAKSLIYSLTAIVAEHGDLPVMVSDDEECNGFHPLYYPAIAEPEEEGEMRPLVVFLV